MSKSAENDASRINLTDDAAAIASKVKRCKTDAVDGLEFGNPDRPEANNLLTLYQLATGKTKVRAGCFGSLFCWLGLYAFTLCHAHAKDPACAKCRTPTLSGYCPTPKPTMNRMRCLQSVAA